MKLCVGSGNASKVQAVQEIREEYSVLKASEVVSKSVDSGVAEQPMSVEETILGAMNRAKAAYEEGGLGIGLEGGLFLVPHVQTEHLKFDVCCIYNGTQVYFGTSSAYEIPMDAFKMMKEQGMNQQQATVAAGYSDDPQVGSKDGMIGVLTRGRVTRKELAKQALRLALIQIENKPEEK